MTLVPLFLALTTTATVGASAGVVVRSHQKVSDTGGGFSGTLDDGDALGAAVASLGDFDGDGVVDIVVGAPGDDDGIPGYYNFGAVWVLFLNSDGTVKSHQKTSWFGILNEEDRFGSSVASLGDINGDGVNDIVVGAPGDDEHGTDRGAVWILFMNSDGTLDLPAKITDHLSFSGTLDDEDEFGSSVASLGDLNGDGFEDLAVGAPNDDDGGVSWSNRGAVWILFLDNNGVVTSHQKISDTEGGFAGTLDDNDYFGRSVALLGDLDGDTVVDLAVGALGDDDGGSSRGAVWVLFLNSNGTVKSAQKISDTEGGFAGTLDDGDYFGCSVASLGDLDGDTVVDLAAGARRDDDGGYDRGASWILFLDTDGTVKSEKKISDTESNFSGVLDDHDHFGCSVASLGDLGGNGMTELVIGAEGDDDGGDARGAIWTLFLSRSTWYVDLANVSGPWDGSPARPFQFVAEAYAAAADGDTIIVHTGAYSENIIMTKQLRIESEGGVVRIGTP